MAYPGMFLLDEHGVVVNKQFEQNYRVRPTARIMEEFALGAVHEPRSDASSASTAELGIRAWTDSPTYRPYQQVRLHLDMDIPAGLHVYAAPAPNGYTPLRVEVEPLDGLTAGGPTFPPSVPFCVAGLDEAFMVFEDGLHVLLPLQFTKNLGPTRLQVRVEYQACTATTCFAPASIGFELDLNGLDLIRD
ncbi:MAG: protein-disulfide reductase DsbD domain-containing protein [Chloroflexota bacterium]